VALLGVSVFVSQSVRAERRDTLPTEHLYAVDTVDGRRAFAVGAFGSVFRSDDAGLSWTAQVTPVNQSLFDVSFVDRDHGIVVGKSGIVLRTSDGGESWQRVESTTRKHLFSAQMTDARRGWAVGDWGVVVHTTDGGATWMDRSLDRDVVLSAVTFADPQHGWIVGEFGTVLATTDGGATWETQDAGTEKTLFGVAFTDLRRGWIVGIDGIVLQTRDGGLTWEVQRGQADAGSLEDLAFLDMLTNPGLYDISISGTRGCIVGDTGTLLVSTDGGESWTQRALPEDYRLHWLRGASIAAGGAGAIVGAKGLVVPLVGGEPREPGTGQQYAAIEAD
jgi:photosystem II stability/assembly factor-like uncharacterized protein